MRRIVSIVLVRCVIGRARVYAQKEEEVNGTCERNEHERRQNKIEKQRERLFVYAMFKIRFVLVCYIWVDLMV